MGFLAPLAPSHSPQWVPFVVTKSPPISPSKGWQIQVEFNTQTLTQKLGLIAGFVWAQMCSSLEGLGDIFPATLVNSAGSTLGEGEEGKEGRLHGPLSRALWPSFLSWCALRGLDPPRRRQRSSPTGRPLSLPSFPFQQVTLCSQLALTLPGLSPCSSGA